MFLIIDIKGSLVLIDLNEFCIVRGLKQWPDYSVIRFTRKTNMVEFDVVVEPERVDDLMKELFTHMSLTQARSVR